MNKFLDFIQMQILPQAGVVAIGEAIDPIDDIATIGQLVIQAVIAIMGIVAALRKSKRVK